MKKILIINTSLEIGGIQTVLLNLLKQLDTSKFEIDLYCLFSVYTLLDNYELPNNVNLFPILKNKKINKFALLQEAYYMFIPGRAAALYKKHITQKYDIEISFSDWGGIHSLIGASPNKQSKKIAFVHFDAELKDFTYHGIYPFADVLSKYDKVICVSRRSAKSLKNKFPTLAHKIKVVYNSIDQARIVRMAESSEDPFGDFEGKNFVAIGRLVKEKGYERLIKAAIDTIKRGEKFNLHFIGDGSERKKLEELSAPIKDNVFFWGEKKNPYPFIKNADITILTSYHEALPTVVLESLAIGTPVLATDVSDLKLLFNRKMVIVTENSTGAIAEGLKTVVKFPPAKFETSLDFWKTSTEEFLKYLES